MQKTVNYNLNVPELTDAPPDITKLSANFPIIDAILKDHEDLFGSYVPLTSVKSKGNETTPIYFDKNGVAQTINRYGGTSARATADGSGNVLTSFYEPKQNLAGKGDSITPVYIDADGVAQECQSLDNYLPLNGGGTVISTILNDQNVVIAGNCELSKDANDTGFEICGGTVEADSFDNAIYHGAFMQLFGENRIDANGYVRLRAHTTNKESMLEMTPSGLFSFNNQSVECVNEKGNDYIRYSNGLQICWGTGTYNYGTHYNVNMPKPFSSQNYKCFISCAQASSTGGFATSSTLCMVAASNTVAYLYNYNGANASMAVNWLAIGWWK